MPSRSALLRLLGYARPYAGIIALGVLLAAGLSLAGYARAWLVKPIFDDVIAPSQALRSAGEQIPIELRDSCRASARPPAAAPALDPDAVRSELERSVAEIRSDVGRIALAAALIILAIPLLGFGHDYTGRSGCSAASTSTCRRDLRGAARAAAALPPRTRARRPLARIMRRHDAPRPRSSSSSPTSSRAS